MKILSMQAKRAVFLVTLLGAKDSTDEQLLRATERPGPEASVKLTLSWSVNK